MSVVLVMLDWQADSKKEDSKNKAGKAMKVIKTNVKQETTGKDKATQKGKTAKKCTASTEEPKVWKKGERPPVPAPMMGTTIFYEKGKVNVSLSKKGYRVFRRSSDRVDKLVHWSAFSRRRDAWHAALDIIDK